MYDDLLPNALRYNTFLLEIDLRVCIIVSEKDLGSKNCITNMQIV